MKTKKHYVGIVWSDKPAATATASAVAPTVAAPRTTTANKETGKGGVIFKVGKGGYRGFIAAPEGVAGIKAVNADAAGSGGTSK